MNRSNWRRNFAGYYWIGSHPHRELRRVISGHGAILAWDVYIETIDGMHMTRLASFPTKAIARRHAEALTMADRKLQSWR